MLPSISAAILLVISFPSFLGGGPLSQHNLNSIATNCIENFWGELLGMSNLVSPTERVSFYTVSLQL